MKLFTVRNHIVKIDEEIDRLMEDLKGQDSYSDEYKDINEAVSKLVETREELSGTKLSSKLAVDPNVLVTGAIGIFTTLLILNYEEEDIITSKAMSFVGKWIGR